MIAIHQPNFFPWLGYFNKIKQSEVFVFLDDVQVVKTGSSWFNRVLIPDFENKKGMWLTAPITRRHGTHNIRDVEISDYQLFREKMMKTLNMRYAHHPYKKQTMELVASIFGDQLLTLNLCQMNAQLVAELSKELGYLNCQFVFSSDCKTSSSATQKLVELTKETRQKTYLCGGGASEYFEEELFVQEGLSVQYQQYKPMPYPQIKSQSFLPGMSILDLLMNVGLSQASQYI